MATLFAELLRPLTPNRAAAMASGNPAAETAGTALPPAEQPSPGRVTDTPAAPTPAAATPASEVDRASVAAPSVDATPIPAGPLVAIVLTELGPNVGSARAAIDSLPPAVSLAFSPYADAARGLAADARKRGHEVWLSVPMQPKSYPRVSPGKNVLLIGESGSENVRRLEWALSRVDQPVGITNMMGSAFTESSAALKPVLAAARSRGLHYVDARSSGKSVGERDAKAAGVAAAMNDRFLDEPATAANIRRNLDDLVATAKRRGHAIGYGRAVPETIREVEAWSAALDGRGVTLVGASVVARRNSGG